MVLDHKISFNTKWTRTFFLLHKPPDYIQTNHYTKFNKPDIVVIHKVKDEILIIEGSCPWDENLEEKVVEKQNKYKSLAIELKSLYQKTNCGIAELVIGATGTVNNSLKTAVEKISINYRDTLKLISNCQKATILGTIRICRQIFDGSV